MMRATGSNELVVRNARCAWGLAGSWRRRGTTRGSVPKPLTIRRSGRRPPIGAVEPVPPDRSDPRMRDVLDASHAELLHDPNGRGIARIRQADEMVIVRRCKEVVPA